MTYWRLSAPLASATVGLLLLLTGCSGSTTTSAAPKAATTASPSPSGPPGVICSSGASKSAPEATALLVTSGDVAAEMPTLQPDPAQAPASALANVDAGCVAGFSDSSNTTHLRSLIVVVATNEVAGPTANAIANGLDEAHATKHLTSSLPNATFFTSTTDSVPTYDLIWRDGRAIFGLVMASTKYSSDDLARVAVREYAAASSLLHPGAAVPTPRASKFNSAADLASALGSAGFECTDFKADSQPPNAATQGRCHYQGEELVLAQFSSTDQRDKDVANLRDLLTGLTASDHYLVVGDNWLVNVGTEKALTDRLASAFGAAVVTAPGQAEPPANTAADGLAAAKKACGYYTQGVAPVIDRAVAQTDGAPLIRIQAGEPPDGGPVDANAPWFLLNATAVNAAGYDSKYSELTNRLDALNKTINGISPSDMAGTVAQVSAAGRAVAQYCSSLG